MLLEYDVGIFDGSGLCPHRELSAGGDACAPMFAHFIFQLQASRYMAAADTCAYAGLNNF